MGKYALYLCLLLQGIPYFYTSHCSLVPIRVNEHLFKGSTTKNSEIFAPVTTSLRVWNRVNKLLPKSHPGPSVLWGTPNIALILGQKNLLKVMNIHTRLGLDKPMLLKAFAIHNGKVSTYFSDNQFLDKELIHRVFANISSYHATITPPEPIVKKGIYVLELQPLNHARLQKLNWLSYNHLGKEPHLTESMPQGLLLEKISNIKSLVKNILNKANLFARLITWEPNPKPKQKLSGFKLFLACSLRNNPEIPCLESIKSSDTAEKLLAILADLGQSQDKESHVLERTLQRISLISNNTKSKYKSFGSYAKVITSWQTHVFTDPHGRTLPHIIDTDFNYENWSKHFSASKTSPYRILPQFDNRNDLTIAKVDDDTPNQNELDIMEQIMFLDNVYILQQFWSFLAKQNMQISQELEHVYMLVNNLNKYLVENTKSLIKQMTGDKTCIQSQKSIECDHGPIKMAGDMEGIKITSRYSLIRNKTYFTPICHPSEEEGGFRNFIWDGQMFVRHRNKLTNSENQFPLACMTKQQQDKLDENCSQYFRLQQTPQSIFLFGNIIVEPTQRKRELCFSQITPDGIMFDKKHTYVDLSNKSCLGDDRFPVYLHDREYSMNELQAFILDRLKPYEQIHKHVGKWTRGVPLRNLAATLRETYEGAQKFFIENTHIWIITLSALSFGTIIVLAITSWKQRSLSNKKATKRVLHLEEETHTRRPLINRRPRIEHFSSPQITERDFETTVELD